MRKEVQGEDKETRFLHDPGDRYIRWYAGVALPAALGPQAPSRPEHVS